MTDNAEYLYRLKKYNEPHCWQYDIRLKTEADDREFIRDRFGIEVEDITISDFEYKLIDDKKGKSEAIEFIKRYEWLGTITQYSTHYFGAYFQGMLGGVLIFSVPNSFSKLMGDETADLERLISRGASASWTPKSLASSFLMWAIKWMVHNTQYRLFTAYSDPTAKELGTIYQACNFYYLGKRSGTISRYINPYTGKIVSDRFFRQKTAYRKYANDLGIEWQKNWASKNGMNWENVPDDIEAALRDYGKQKQAESVRIEYPSKHKYAMVLGRTSLETRQLRKRFLAINKVYPYPKVRGE